MSLPRPRSFVGPALAASLSACFNSPSYTPILTFSTTGPAAGLQTGLVPTGATSVFVLGFFLNPDTLVYGNGRPQQTTWFAAPPPEMGGQVLWGPRPVLRVDLDAEATKVAGPLILTAMGDGTLMSAPLELFVVDARLTLTDVAPGQIAAGAPATTIVLTGTGFNPSSQVSWNGNALPTTFLSSTSVSAIVPASFLTIPGDATVELRGRSCSSPDPRSCTTDATSTICTVGRAKKIVVPGNASNVGWDATHSLLLAVILQPPATYLLATIDPQTGGVRAGVAVESPSNLSISAGDQFVYVANMSSARRYSLPDLTGGVVLPHPGQRVVAAPEAPQTAALFDGLTLSVLDGTAVRPNTAQGFGLLAIWGFDASRMYGISDYVSGVQTYAVDATGVMPGASLGSPSVPIQNDLVFDRVLRRIYGGRGENVNESGSDPRPFAIPPAAQCKLAVDRALGKAFFACSQSRAGLTVRSFDLQTQQQLSAIVLSSADVSGLFAIVRWGSDGLAIASAPSLYLYSGQFVR